jgi:hypothetical protein
VDAKAALMHAHRNNIRRYRSCLRRISRMPSATTSKGDSRQRAVLQALQSTEAHRQQDKQLAARRADEPVLKIECEQR